MSERDCPDERMVEWIEHKKQMGYYVLTKEERDEWLDEAQRDAYVQGRAEYNELMSVVEEILNAGHMNTEDLARLRAAWEAL